MCKTKDLDKLDGNCCGQCGDTSSGGYDCYENPCGFAFLCSDEYPQGKCLPEILTEIYIRTSVIPVHYSKIINMIENKELRQGQWYLIDDYHTTYYQAHTGNLMGTGEPNGPGNASLWHIEPLMVVAVSDHEIHNNALSVLHPHDVINYTPYNDKTRFGWCYENGTGVIYYRKDDKNNSATYDFREVTVKRMLVDIYSGLMWKSENVYKYGDIVAYETTYNTYPITKRVHLFFCLAGESGTITVPTDTDKWGILLPDVDKVYYGWRTGVGVGEGSPWSLRLKQLPDNSYVEVPLMNTTKEFYTWSKLDGSYDQTASNNEISISPTGAQYDKLLNVCMMGNNLASSELNSGSNSGNKINASNFDTLSGSTIVESNGITLGLLCRNVIVSNCSYSTIGDGSQFVNLIMTRSAIIESGVNDSGISGDWQSLTGKGVSIKSETDKVWTWNSDDTFVGSSVKNIDLNKAHGVRLSGTVNDVDNFRKTLSPINPNKYPAAEVYQTYQKMRGSITPVMYINYINNSNNTVSVKLLRN